MAARIRRAGVAVAFALLMATALTGAAWAATKVGTNGSDLLIGTNARDTIYGLNGPDDVLARASNDRLYGGSDSDEIHGGRNADYIVAGQGPDDLFGGRGTDVIEAADGFHEQDFVDCGLGLQDRAGVDANDDVMNCEIVNGERAQ
jgi:Ca2+-binding RTX toxin-like protein